MQYRYTVAAVLTGIAVLTSQVPVWASGVTMQCGIYVIRGEGDWQAWMNSPGHRANILNKNYTKIDVGYEQNSAVILSAISGFHGDSRR